MDNCDVAVVPAGLFDASPIPLRTSARLVVDLCEPVAVTSDALRVGDFYLCATEPQRDYWLEVLVAHGRVGRRTAERDGRLCRLIDVVDAGPSSLPGDCVPASGASLGEPAWQRGVDPLRCYCGNAGRTRDALPWVSPSLTFRALRVFRQEGARALATKSAAYLRRRLGGA